MNAAAGIVANCGLSWREILERHKSYERIKARARRRVVCLLQQRYPGHGFGAWVRRQVAADWIVMRLMRSYEKTLKQRTRGRRSPYALYGVR